jgi:hypothetical protein
VGIAQLWPRWLDASCRRRLGWGLVASVAVPWGVGEVAKAGRQAGLSDDPVRSQLLIDYIVIGAIVFALTMVMTYAIGCWITAVMKGPERTRDPLPLPDNGRHDRPQ